VRQPEHEVRWFTPADITATPEVSEDSRVLATRLLDLAAPQPGPGFRWPPDSGRGTPDGRQADGIAETIREKHGRHGLPIVGLTDRICDYGYSDLRFHVTGMFMT
jgi:hypothetical protein